MDKAFVTLATNDSYSIGALVVGWSLQLVKTTSSTVCMITEDVSSPMRSLLEKVFTQVHIVQAIDSQDISNLSLLDRPNLGITFTKLHCWRLEQYSKCVFLDADTLVLSNCDELFGREELSAAPDPGWPDCFNSGVFVYVPSRDTYDKLVSLAKTSGSFDGGDQGLLNLYFSSWAHSDINKHLPFLYNVVSQAFYSYLPAFKRFGKDTKICHFIGPVKPWQHSVTGHSGTPVMQSQTGFTAEFLDKWWQIFTEHVRPQLEQTQVSSPSDRSEPSTHAPSLMEVTMPHVAAGGRQVEHRSDAERQSTWERGVIDYTGADSFENIRKKLDEKMFGEDGKDPMLAAEEEGSQLAASATTSTNSKEEREAGTPHDTTGADVPAPQIASAASIIPKAPKGVLKKPK